MAGKITRCSRRTIQRQTRTADHFQAQERMTERKERLMSIQNVTSHADFARSKKDKSVYVWYLRCFYRLTIIMPWIKMPRVQLYLFHY